jgi:hypothetical protein
MTPRCIKLTIPIGLIASRIQRVNPSIDDEAAEVLAAELCDLVAWVRKFCRVRPLVSGAYAASETTDIVETVLRTAFHVWPSDPDGNARRSRVAANEAIWLAERFMKIDAGDGLYDRYIDLCSKIAGWRVDQ